MVKFEDNKCIICTYHQGNGGKRSADLVEASDAVNVLEGYETAYVLTVSRNDPRAKCVLDLGANFHVTWRKDWLYGGRVLTGNNVSCVVKGVGSMKLKLADGAMKILTDVRNTSGLKRNMISLRTLDAKGYKIRVRCGVLEVFKGNVVVLRGSLSKSLYILHRKTMKMDESWYFPEAKQSVDRNFEGRS